jgi:ribosomal protein S18 acetylase RimI-like enzyme
MSIACRLAGPADVSEVARLFDLYRQFYEQPPDLKRATAFIAERMACGDSVTLVAHMTSGELVGFCQLYPSFCSVEAAPIYVLYDLYAVPESRGQGVGRLLLQAAERQARGDGKCRMDLTTARSNVSAQGLYEAMGWVLDEVFLSYSRRVTA